MPEIKKSLKIKLKTNLLIILKTFRNIIFTFIDFIYIALTILNLKNNKIAKNKKVTIVTAADESHYKSAEQLIKSIFLTNKNFNVIFYDLDKKNTFDFEINSTFNFKYKKFDFDNYPNFFSEKFFSDYDDSYKLGYYAWKAAILQTVSKDLDGILIWCDAGNIISKKLSLLIKIITKKQFYSPISSNRVVHWTHNSLIEKLELSKNILKKRNLSSGLVCFDLSSDISRKLIEQWFDWSKNKSLIAPDGSNRSNHRQDQTLITLIYHSMIGKALIPKTHKIFGVEFHQDI